MEGQQMKQKQPDMHGNEINDPYNVITSRMTGKIQELAEHIGSLKNPEKLLEAYAVGRDLATLTSTLLEIYEPSLKNLGLTVGLDQIERANEMYRSKLVEKLSGNKGISPLVLGTFSKKDSESHKRFVSACFDFTKRGKK